MDWKKILSLGALAGFAWFVFRAASSQGQPAPGSGRYLDDQVNPIAANALGLAPLQSSVYRRFGFKFAPSEPFTPAVSLPVGWSGLFEGGYVPSGLSNLEAR